jgi:hypothetical protein
MYIFMELTFDTIVFLLTIVRTTFVYWRHRQTESDSITKWSLLHNLMRDGAFYFAYVKNSLIRSHEKN